MKIIFTIEMDDERLKAEGVTPENALAQFRALKEELQDEAPDGTVVTLTLEP